MELQITNFQRNLIERYCSALEALYLCKAWLSSEKQGTYIKYFNVASESCYIVQR